MSNIVRSRAYSAKSKPSSRDQPNNSKPAFQIKWKDKTNGSKLYDAPPSSNNQQNSQTLTDSFYDDYAKKIIKHRKATSLYNRTNNNLNKTQSQLCNVNFKHHDNDLCVCQQCTCGRHLCKLHVIGPNLSKASVYQMSYPKKGHIPNKINISKEYPKCEGPHLDINSIQRKDYKGTQGDDIQRPIPEDLLKTGGPCNNLTSYSSGFPGYKGDNQYVPPTDRHFRGPMPLNAKTTYGNFFKPNNGRKASLEKTNDSFRHGQPWYGSTSYSNNFKIPTTQDYPKHYKIIEKYQQNPNFKKQYETIYRNDFLNSGSKVCPAKMKLQTILRGRMNQTKGKFSQNTDFKALSPQFHALSLSKQTFV